MAREIEKSLEQELQRALKDQDKAQADADVAKGVYDAAARAVTKANNEVKGLSRAIVALRGNADSEAAINNLIKDARADMGGRPVA